MKAFKTTGLSILIGGILAVSVTAGYVVPILTTEIDPNLGKAQCPGGKNWDRPGSSCHEGMIVDYSPPVVSEPTLQKIKRKR